MSDNIVLAARVAHEVNRVLRKYYDNPEEDSPTWIDAPESQRASVIDGVKGILAGNTPEESHENWLEFKRNDGWVYGPVKDEAAKTHPCFVPYSELPPEQQLKDHVFAAVVVGVCCAR